MATTLKGIRPGLKGKLTKSGNSQPVYTESKVAVIYSDIKDESPYNVLMTSGLPTVGFSRLTPSGAVCTDLDPQQDTKCPYLWFVNCEYSTATDKQETGTDPNPTTWVPIYTGKIETIPEVVYYDFSSTPKPYLNSARCKFPEPLIVKRPVIVYDFVQYEAASITDAQIADRNDTVNSASITRGTPSSTFAAGVLKCTITDFERGYFFGLDAVKIHYSIAFKRNKWLNVPLDMGYEYYVVDAGTGVKTKRTSEFIVALNPDGTKRADDADPLTLEFKQHKEISFSFLR